MLMVLRHFSGARTCTGLLFACVYLPFAICKIQDDVNSFLALHLGKTPLIKWTCAPRCPSSHKRTLFQIVNNVRLNWCVWPFTLPFCRKPRFSPERQRLWAVWERDSEQTRDIQWHIMYKMQKNDCMHNYGKDTCTSHAHQAFRHLVITIGGNYTKHSSIFGFSELIENICSMHILYMDSILDALVHFHATDSMQKCEMFLSACFMLLLV